MEHTHRTSEPAEPGAERPNLRTADAQPIRSATLDDLIVQAKLSVGPASDPFEVEADAVADRVVRVLRSPTAGRPDASIASDASKVQRSPAIGTAGIAVSSAASTVDSVQRWPAKASSHFRQRAAQRGISSQQADDAFAGGQTHVDEGSGAKVYWDQTTGVALILSADGESFVTCYNQKNKKGKWKAV